MATADGSTGEVAGRQPDAASHDRGGTRSIAATEPGSEGLRARVAPKRLVMTKDGHFDPYEIESQLRPVRRSTWF